MVKRIIAVLAVVLAVAVAAPAGFAAEKPGKGSRQAQLKSLAEKAQQSCRKAKDQAGNGKAHRKQCAKALRELLAALKATERSIQRMQSRLEQVIAEKCTGTENADRCAKARERLERLESAEAKVHALIEKIESRLRNAGEGNSSASVSDEEIESVDELQEELEAAGK